MNINWIVLVWNRAEIKYKYYMENQKNNKLLHCNDKIGFYIDLTQKEVKQFATFL